MHRRSKVGLILIFISVLPASYLVWANLSDPIFFGRNIYVSIRDVYVTHSFPSGNKPFYRSFLITTSLLAGIPLHQLLDYPFSGILIILGEVLFLKKTRVQNHNIGLVVLVSTLTVHRSPWSYSITRIDFFLFLMLVLGLYIWISNEDHRFGLLVLLLFISLNMFYYTAGAWAIVLILTLVLTDYIIYKNLDTGLISYLLASSVFYIYFTDQIYRGFFELFGSLSAGISRLFVSIGFGVNTVQNQYVYTGSQNTLTLINSGSKVAELIVLLIASILFLVSLANDLLRTYSTTLRKQLAASIMFVAVFDTLLYLFVGTFVLRLEFFAILLLLPFLLKEIYNRGYLIEATLIVFLILSSAAMVTSIGTGDFNDANPNNVNPAKYWVEKYGDKKVLSDLETLSYVVLDTDIDVVVYDLSLYTSILGESSTHSNYYVFLNENTIKEPVITAGGTWATFEPLQKHHHEVNTNSDLNKIYSKEGMVIYS